MYDASVDVIALFSDLIDVLLLVDDEVSMCKFFFCVWFAHAKLYVTFFFTKSLY